MGSRRSQILIIFIRKITWALLQIRALRHGALEAVLPSDISDWTIPIMISATPRTSKNDCTWVCLYINKSSCAVITPELTRERFCSFIPRICFKSIVDGQEPVQWTHRKTRTGMGWEQGCHFTPDSRKQHTRTMSRFCFTSQKKNPPSLALGLTAACARGRAKNQTASLLKSRLRGVSVL